MDSPFNRSSRTPRTPPPTSSPAPELHPRTQSQNKDDGALDVITSAELQNWVASIEQYLNEVCHIASEGKLNSEQKLRIHNLCRKVGNGTSSMGHHYQALKIRLVKANSAIQTLQDRCDLSQQLQDLKASIKETSKSVTGPSFSEMVKRGPNNFFKPINVSSVAIYPNDKGISSEDTKTLVQKIIRPEEMNLHVRGLRKTKNGGVIISTETKEDVEKLKKSSDITKSGLSIDEPPKRKPRIVVIGVPSIMQEKEVFTCLFRQNLADQLPQLDIDTFLASTKLSHKSGKKDRESCNYIIEVSAEIRKALISKDRVFVNWSSCPVRDFTLVTRCFKCQQYGHAAKTCREATYTCGYCGDQGHSIKECTKKADPPKCATCSRFKKSNDHSTGAADCPAKIMSEKRYLNSIDYGGA